MEPIHERLFSKLVICCQFQLSYLTLQEKKNCFDYFEISKKKFQKFYDVIYSLNLILECYLSKKTFLKVKL